MNIGDENQYKNPPLMALKPGETYTENGILVPEKGYKQPRISSDVDPFEGLNRMERCLYCEY